MIFLLDEFKKAGSYNGSRGSSFCSQAIIMTPLFFNWHTCKSFFIFFGSPVGEMKKNLVDSIGAKSV